jgi:RHS repeat-associated protein
VNNQSTYYYVSDLLGSVAQLVGSTGIVQAQYQYDPYGIQSNVNVSNLSSDMGYTGLFTHNRSGLVFARYREYIPAIGRWLSRDSFGEFPGDLNLMSGNFSADLNPCSYVRNNPVSKTDRSGLQTDLSLGLDYAECVAACALNPFGIFGAGGGIVGGILKGTAAKFVAGISAAALAAMVAVCEIHCAQGPPQPKRPSYPCQVPAGANCQVINGTNVCTGPIDLE